MTLFLVANSTTTVTISDISLEIGFMPTWSNLQAYQGYFHSSEELLNRIWYSGAYTLQTNSVPVNTGMTLDLLLISFLRLRNESCGALIAFSSLSRSIYFYKTHLIWY
jgi:hypothetical protein